jgi:hypothetical protein
MDTLPLDWSQSVILAITSKAKLLASSKVCEVSAFIIILAIAWIEIFLSYSNRLIIRYYHP